MPLTVGIPIMTSSPSAISRMRSKSNFLPASTGRRSPSMVRPSAARYCLPPLSTIANLILFSSHSLRRVPAGHSTTLRPSPANGEAGGLQATAPAILTAEAEADDIIHVGWGCVNERALVITHKSENGGVSSVLHI